MNHGDRDATEPSVTHVSEPGAFAGEQLEIVGPAYQHLFRSRRLAVGAGLRIVDGLGRARRGTVTHIERKRAEVELGPDLPSHEPERRVHLFVGALRPERADWLVEKTTELGVTSITFLATERTPRRYGDGRLERQQRVAVSAVEQCRRSRVPEIRGVVPWDDILSKPLATSTFVLDGGGENAFTAAARLPSGAVAHLFIGPEGGFTDDEIHQLKASGASAWSLGGTVLRVETAAVVATGAVLGS